MKPSDTKWLSHKCCIWAIYRELPALIVTLQQLYETSGDAEAYGRGTLLAEVASVVFQSQVLDILAQMNTFKQMKLADYNKLPIVLKVTIDQLQNLREQNSEWISLVESEISQLRNEYKIEINTRCHESARSRSSSITTTFEVCSIIAIPYIDALIENIKKQFTAEAVKIVTARSINIQSFITTTYWILPTILWQ